MSSKDERFEYYADRVVELITSDDEYTDFEIQQQVLDEIVEKFDVTRRTARRTIPDDYKSGKSLDRDKFWCEQGYRTPCDKDDKLDEETDGDESEMDNKLGEDFLKEGEYHHDDEEGVYLIYLESAGEIIEIPDETMSNIFEWYSNWTGDTNTINEICQRIGFPRPWFDELRREMGLTHDREPFTPEEVVEKDTEQLVDDLLQKKRRDLALGWESAQAEVEEEQAGKWRELKAGQITPVVDALQRVENSGDHSFDLDVNINPADTDETFDAVIGLADCHIGHVDHAADPGSFSADDAGKRTVRAFEKTIGRTLRYGTPEVIRMGFLGDFFHVDSEDLATSWGTSMEASGLLESILMAGYKTAHTIIEIASDVAPVKARVLEGNHDRAMSKAMAIHLKDKYEGHDNVEFNLDFDERQYEKSGDNMIAWWHGDSIRDSQVDEVIADEANDIWGATQNRYLLYGHVHPEKIDSSNRGLTKIRLNGPAGETHHDKKNGYDPGRQMCSIVMHPEEGKIGMPQARIIEDGEQDLSYDGGTF